MFSRPTIAVNLSYPSSMARTHRRRSISREPETRLSMSGKQRTFAASHTIALVFVAALLTACGTFGSGNDEDDRAPGEVTPTSDDVYANDTYLHVQLEPQDESQGAVPPNDHPVDVSAAQVRAWLAEIEVRPAGGDETIPLIPADLMPQLSVLLAQALGDAARDQDVVFYSFRKAGSWFGSVRRDTTARVFYRDGTLNLIFGDLDDFYSEFIDRDLQPLEPGFRDVRSDLSGTLILSREFAFVNDRADWIRVDTSAMAKAEPAIPSAPVSAPAAAAPPPTAQTTQDPRWTQLEERLLILDGLREKGLITQKDYEIKKQELLEVLDL